MSSFVANKNAPSGRNARGYALGVAAVEGAIVLPLFLSLIFALMDFSMFLFRYSELTDSVAETTRIAAVKAGRKLSVDNSTPTCRTVVNKVQALLHDTFCDGNQKKDSNLEVSLEVAGPSNGSRNNPILKVSGKRKNMCIVCQFLKLDPVGSTSQLSIESTKHSCLSGTSSTISEFSCDENGTNMIDDTEVFNVPAMQ